MKSMATYNLIQGKPNYFISGKGKNTEVQLMLYENVWHR